MRKIQIWVYIDIRHRLERLGVDVIALKKWGIESLAAIRWAPARFTTTAISCAAKSWARLSQSCATRPWAMPLGCACIVLIIAAPFYFYLIRPPRAPALSATESFYDLNTGSLFEVKAGTVPPVDAPSGPLPDGSKAGVRAYLFRYDGDSNSFVGFLETTAGPARQNETWQSTHLIKTPDDNDWYPAGSPEAIEIRRSFTEPDPSGRTPIFCRPHN
jgi:hypothetical protein